MHKISGTYCAVLTPINEDFSINLELFLKHCEYLLTQNLDGLAIFGTTGEANSFNVEEKLHAINYLIDNKIDPSKLLPGTGQCSLKDTIKMTRAVANLKVRGALVLPPFYYKNVKNESIIQFYQMLVEEVKEEEFKYILYQIPQNSGVNISIDIIESLISKLPNNIVGIKDSSGKIDEMIQTIHSFEKFSVFSGSDSLALQACKKGGAGAITATANVSGKLLSYIVKKSKADIDIEDLGIFQKLQEKIRQTVFAHEPISVMKAFLSIKNQNIEWNRLNVPLTSIKDPSNNQTIKILNNLINEMDNILLSS